MIMVAKINTEKYEGIISKVLIDNREGKRVEYGLNQYSPFNPITAQLDYGDYIFIGHNGIKVVFEYKTGSDFLNSINSETHHLHNQVYDMIHNEDYTFVIVECVDLMQEVDDLYYSTGITISLQQINGAISEYSTVSTVLMTQTQYQAFDLMMRISGKIIQEKPFLYKYGKKSTNHALNWLSAQRGLNNKAEDICRTLNIKTKKDLDNLTKEQLTSVEGIGSKTADKILQDIHGE